MPALEVCQKAGTRVRRVARVLCLAMVLLFSLGCSGIGLLPSPTPGPVALRFGYREFIMDPQPLVNDFQAKHPWIRIELVKADRFSDDLTTRVRNKQVDVFRGYRSALGLAQEGLLKPVDELVGDEWSTTRGDYFEGTWGGLSVQGRQWGIPAGVDMMMTYVNKDQLAALKLDTPGTDWDLFEFLSLAHDMNYPDGVPYGDDIKLFGFCTSPDSVDPVVLISLHGGKIVDDIYSPTVATLDAPLTVEAVQTYTSPGLNTVGSSLYEAIQKILARDLGVEDAMSEAQSKCGNAFRNP